MPPEDGVLVDVLENGLAVVLSEIRIAPVAAFVMAFRAGSLWEREGSRGMSHFCEHMMFKGSREVTASEFWQRVQRNGAVANAFTSRDMTAYFTALPSCGLDDILDLESDRMLHPLFEEKEVDAERSVVMQERRSSCIDNPAGAIDELLFLTSFRSHPYRHPITGYDDDISRFDSRGLKCFHSAFYAPSNAVIVVAGDIDSLRVRERIGELFGAGGAAAPERETPEEHMTGLSEAELTHESDLPRLSMAFSCPPGVEADSVFLELLSMHLAGARSSALEQDLVQAGLALDVSASVMSGVSPGLFAVRATLYPGVESSRAEEVILSAMEGLRTRNLLAEDVDDLRARFLAYRILGSAGPVGRAADVSLGMILFGDPGYAARAASTARSATPDMLREAAVRWLDPERMAVVRLVPLGAGASAAIPASVAATPRPVDHQLVPDPEDPARLEVHPQLLSVPRAGISDGAVDTRHGNGLRVVLRRESTFPVAAIGFSTPIGSLREPPRLSGLASVTVEAMHYGNGAQGYREFNGRLERLGSEIDFSAGPESAHGGVFVLKEDLPEALSVIADLLRKPAFRDRDVLKVIEEKVTEVVERRESPFGLALDLLASLMAGGEEAARLPTEGTLGAIGPSDVRSFYASCAAPERTVLTLVGDIDEGMALELIDRSFGGWTASCGVPPPIVPVPVVPAGGRSSHRMEGKTQTAVLVGTAAPPRDDEGSEAFRLLNTILGDGIGSRMGRVVRERLGMAYSAGSEYLPGTGSGRFLAYLSTSGADAFRGLDAVLEIMRGMASEEASVAEVRLAQAMQAGRHVMSLADLEHIALRLAANAALGRPLDHDMQSIARTLSAGPRALREAADRWFDPGHVFVAMAGAEAEGS